MAKTSIYFEDIYKLRDEIFERNYPRVRNHKLREMFNAGFDAMLEIIDTEIATEERTEIKLENDKLI